MSKLETTVWLSDGDATWFEMGERSSGDMSAALQECPGYRNQARFLTRDLTPPSHSCACDADIWINDGTYPTWMPAFDSPSTFMGRPVIIDDNPEQRRLEDQLVKLRWAGTTSGRIDRRQDFMLLEDAPPPRKQHIAIADIERRAIEKHEEAKRLAGHPIDNSHPHMTQQEFFNFALGESKYIGRTYDHLITNDPKPDTHDAFSMLTNRVDSEDLEVFSSFWDGWQIWVPKALAESLTPDTAPELERRLTLALRMLKEGK